MIKHILPKKIFTRNVKILIAIYLGILLLIYITQRDLMYYPVAIDRNMPSVYDLEIDRVQTRTSDGLVLNHWFAPAQNETYPIIVFFHGNGGHLGYYTSVYKDILNQGFGLFAVEYRGYGDNDGEISEGGLYSDGHSVMKWLLNRGYTKDDIYLLGLSLGSGVAVEMARTYDVKGLILVSPFTSAVEVGQSFYWYVPVSMFIKDRFENDLKISEIKTPLLIVHGKQDNLVSYQLGQKLYDLARDPKKLVLMDEAGHNNIFMQGAFQHISEFILE